ncbi:hypothetical protein [Brevundimonas sp.]|uniref:hypothetical protein n=1 Tax=Brevundimonas sp. TaxID=1871086 RepID=UPI00286AE88C|nr:hypothetical protein [Brevundimonas sp.]
MKALFSGEALSSLRDEALAALYAAVNGMAESQLGTDPAVLEALVDQTLPAPARIHRSEVTFEIGEASLKSFDLLSRPRHEDGILVLLKIPFSGDARYFNVSAAAGFEVPPDGGVEGQTLLVPIPTTSTDETTVVAEVDARLDRIERLLAHQAEEVARWRSVLRQAAVRAIEDRRARLAMETRTIAALEEVGLHQTPASPR